MKEVTATGQNVEHAVNAALEQLNSSKEEVDIQIIDEGKKGIFGLFGSKPAVVHVQLKPDPVDTVVEYLHGIIEKMGYAPKIEVEKSDQTIKLNITGENLALLIGKRGQTLNALQLLTQLTANRMIRHHVKVMLDVGDYREKREQSLKLLAERLAARVAKTKRSIRLEPMPSFERKVIHSALAKNNKVATFSEGTEPNRYVVVALAGTEHGR
ncbi:RNA-binding cell elongation regulator Jag/EloR [Heyndrickxia acidiproducens]|uniref:RNA-binding cell elongation regulator Jag/EloR n=1 Tax=Heyndrickxia acidiproducens TaxID=1121084 RepID=UPI000381BDCB|nr:RNA-binding cell elongation regulator Jag/EloR [Heyndrickxia acidiproducens]